MVVSAVVFASPKFFLFLVRRYSGASCLQACRKLAAGRELSHGYIQVASEFRLGGEALFAQREALFVAALWVRVLRSQYQMQQNSPT